jgi:hypothetical protein
MKFDQSGLPASKLIEDAFNHSYAHLMSGQTESLNHFKQQIDLAHRQNMMMLEAEKRRGMPEEEYNKEKAMLERMHGEQLKMGPALIQKEFEKNFSLRRLRPALELNKHSDAATPEALAAILLVDCVRSPRDYIEIEKNFGPAVGRIIAEVVHMEAYPAKRLENLAAADAATKRTYSALTLSNLDLLVEQVAQLAKSNSGQRIVFPQGQEQHIFEAVKISWGNDAKLDARTVDAFNRAAGAVGSLYRIEVKADGQPDLVRGTPPVPPVNKNKLPAVKGPKGNGSIGGDVF